MSLGLTKKELAGLITDSFDEPQLFWNGPRVTAHKYWQAFEAASTREERATLLAEYLASKHTLVELERWADSLTAPDAS